MENQQTQTTDQSQGQTGQVPGGGSPDGQRAPSGQQVTPPSPPAAPTLPSELSAVGFKTPQDVLAYIAQVNEDANRSKAVAKNLMTQVATKHAENAEPEVTDDDFINSPKAATERVTGKLMRQFEARINPLAGQLVEGNVQLQKMQLMKDPMYGEVMPDLEPELDAFLATLPSNQKAQPNAVRTAMDYVIGKNFKKIAQKWNTVQARQASGTEGGSGGFSSNNSGGGGRKQVSDDERRVAETQISAGIFKDLDEYVKWRDGEEA